MRILLLLFLLSCSFNPMFSQESIPVVPVLNNGFEPVGEGDWNYQILLKEPLKKVHKVEYRESGEQIMFRLSNDGSRIFLRNYDEKTGLNILAEKVDGVPEEIVKSKCYVDRVIPL